MSCSEIKPLQVTKELPEGGNTIGHHLPRWRSRVTVRSKVQLKEHQRQRGRRNQIKDMNQNSLI